MPFYELSVHSERGGIFLTGDDGSYLCMVVALFLPTWCVWGCGTRGVVGIAQQPFVPTGCHRDP